MSRFRNYDAFTARAELAFEKHSNSQLRNDIAIRYMKLVKTMFNRMLQERFVTFISVKFRYSETVLRGFLRGEDTAELSPAEELREFLLTFDIKENAITKEMFITKHDVKFTIDELSLNAELNHFNTRHLKKFLNSDNENITVVKKFNPIQEFFIENAKNWDGEDYISMLADTIPVKNFGTGKNYHTRMKYYLKKWLIKSVLQGLEKQQNDAMLLFLEGKGGSGKSWLNKWLFSLPEFRGYYHRVGENVSYMPFEKYNSQKFVIDFDELPLSKKRYLPFKSNIAALSNDTYVKGKGFVNVARFANYIGSSNKINRDGQDGFLLDDDDAMKRRIIPIELDGRIDYETYLKTVDLYQLWAQVTSLALQELERPDSKFLTYEIDYDDLREENRRYVNEKDKDIAEFINNHLRPARKKAESSVIMNASDTLNYLNARGLDISMTAQQMASHLKKLNFKQTRKGRNYKGYMIIYK